MLGGVPHVGNRGGGELHQPNGQGAHQRLLQDDRMEDGFRGSFVPLVASTRAGSSWTSAQSLASAPLRARGLPSKR